MTHPALHATVLLGLATQLSACADLSPSRAAHVATGYVSHQLCSAVFVGGQDPERAYREAIEPLAGPMAFLVERRIDREQAEVRATIAGLAESRAVHRPPYGCVNATGQSTADPLGQGAGKTLATFGSESPVVEPADPRLRAALARAFEESSSGPRRHTHAVVVMQRERIVAERYADGIGVDTPLAG